MPSSFECKLTRVADVYYSDTIRTGQSASHYKITLAYTNKSVLPLL